MADEADIAGEDTARENLIMNDKVAFIRLNAQYMPVGTTGFCRECDKHFTRLINGYCGRCRDELKIN